jgi:hypothetical protein
LAANNRELTPFFNLMKAIGTFAKDTLAPILGKTLGAAFTVLGEIIAGLISTFATFVDKITAIYNTIKGIIDAIKGAGSAVGNFFSGASFGGSTALATPSAPMATPTPSKPLFTYASAGTTNITVNGAIDSESTARQIVSILNDSQARGTLGSSAFV